MSSTTPEEEQRLSPKPRCRCPTFDCSSHGLFLLHRVAGNCRHLPAMLQVLRSKGWATNVQLSPHVLHIHGCSAERRPLFSRRTFALNSLHSFSWVLLGISCFEALLSEPQGTFLSYMLCLAYQNVSSHQATKAAEVRCKLSCPYGMGIHLLHQSPLVTGPADIFKLSEKSQLTPFSNCPFSE